jgi:hypothetical protein
MGRVAAAFAVLPLLEAYPNPARRARILVVTQALRERFADRVGVVCDVASRAYLVTAQLRYPWIFLRDCRADMRQRVVETLTSWRRALVAQFAAWISEMTDDYDSFIRLLDTGIRHNLTPDQVVQAIGEVSPGDVDTLIAEVEQSTRSTQVYAGPELING